jgi:hypothetical protein
MMKPRFSRLPGHARGLSASLETCPKGVRQKVDVNADSGQQS